MQPLLGCILRVSSLWSSFYSIVFRWIKSSSKHHCCGALHWHGVMAHNVIFVWQSAMKVLKSSCHDLPRSTQVIILPSQVMSIVCQAISYNLFRPLLHVVTL